MLGIEPLWLATGILILVYAVLVTEKVNRAVLAMLGGITAGTALLRWRAR